MSFVFRFDPSVSERITESAREIEDKGLGARFPFDSRLSLLDWSQEQLCQYRARMRDAGLDASREAREYLSPYLIPLPIQGTRPEVEALIAQGYVTVVRLVLDGGNSGTRDAAIQSVKEQLESLNAQSTVFLPHAGTPRHRRRW